MIIARSFIIFMLLVITTQSYQLSAAERLEVEIRSTILNIRETRSTISPVVGVLNQGDRLTATTTDLRDWLNLDDGRGFISINYVYVLSRTPVLLAPPEEVELQIPPATEANITRLSESLTKDAQQVCIQNKVDKPLPIDSSSKTCRKNLNTLGYESCQLLFKLSLTNNCNDSEQLRVVCSATALATDSQKNQALYELTNTRIVSSSVTETTILLEWFPAAESAAIQKIELSKGQCEIAL